MWPRLWRAKALIEVMEAALKGGVSLTSEHGGWEAKLEQIEVGSGERWECW